MAFTSNRLPHTKKMIEPGNSVGHESWSQSHHANAVKSALEKSEKHETGFANERKVETPC